MVSGEHRFDGGVGKHPTRLFKSWRGPFDGLWLLIDHLLCGCNLLALTIIGLIIQKGIPETQIIEKMSSPEQFWKILLHSAEMCQFSTTVYVKEQKGDPLKISDSGNSKSALQEEESNYNEKGLDYQWKLGMSSCETDTLKTISNLRVSIKGTYVLFFKTIIIIIIISKRILTLKADVSVSSWHNSQGKVNK